MASDLKACPFCGADGHLAPSETRDGLLSCWGVECTSENCATLGPIAGEHATAEAATAAWNRRTPTPDPVWAMLVEALELFRLDPDRLVAVQGNDFIVRIPADAFAKAHAAIAAAGGGE